MADEKSVFGQALALIPGVGGGKPAKRPPSHKQRLAAIQRSLAKLTHEVERLTAIILPKPTRTARPKPKSQRSAAATRKRSGAARKSSTAHKIGTKARKATRTRRA
jgi:hypothetical protein